jgi:hypothetical protein
MHLVFTEMAHGGHLGVSPSSENGECGPSLIERNASDCHGASRYGVDHGIGRSYGNGSLLSAGSIIDAFSGRSCVHSDVT